MDVERILSECNNCIYNAFDDYGAVYVKITFYIYKHTDNGEIGYFRLLLVIQQNNKSTWILKFGGNMMSELTGLNEKGYCNLEEYITVQEFCRLMKISQTTAYRMIKDKQIPTVKIGRRYKIPKSLFDRLNLRYL